MVPNGTYRTAIVNKPRRLRPSAAFLCLAGLLLAEPACQRRPARRGDGPGGSRLV